MATKDAEDTRYRQLVEAAPDAILLVTREGIIDLVNAQTEHLFGYTRDELLGQPVEVLMPLASRATHPQQRATFRADPRPRAMGQGRRLRGRRKDGSEFFADISLAPVFTDGGRMTGVVVRDVTQQRMLEERVEVVQRVEAIGRLAGGVAHDFNNMLTVIFNFGRFVLETLDATSAAASDMQELLNAAERARGLTEKLLTFSRQRTIEPRRVDLNQTVTSIDRMLRRLLGADIDYCTRLRSELWLTWVDPGAIEQVIVNLALNARHAMPGGGKLTVETDNVELDERSARGHATEAPGGDYVVIAVTDSGHGMDAETKARIFEPFFTTKAEGSGTGLGLATSYGIVKQAGGYIWVYSEVGHGTTFKLYLPRAVGEAEPLPASEHPATLHGTEMVLVAEDEEQVRALTVRALRRLGYTVLAAGTGSEALELVQHHGGSLHLLLTDVIMPGLNGKELALRASTLQPRLRVLYMSGYTSNVVVHHGVLDAGVSLLQKPFTPDQLARKVRQVLDG
jgi:PAS domain S-box-containing protein